MESIFSLALKIKEEIILHFDIVSLFLIGSYKEKLSDNYELDLVAIIKDDESKIKFINTLSKAIVKYISEEKIFIQCFPISLSDFESENSMFIKNIIKYGKKIH